MRLEKPLELCAQILNSLECKSVHVDVSLNVNLPGFYGSEILTSGQLELFDCPATIHIFSDLPFTGTDLENIRRKDRVMLHVFPETSKDQIFMLLENSCQIGYEPAVALDIKSDLNIIDAFICDLKVIYIMGTPIATHSLSPDKLTKNRMKQLRKTIESKNSTCILGIDGGINHETFTDIATLADEIVIGGLLFNTPNIYSQWKALNAWLEKIEEVL